MDVARRAVQAHEALLSDITLTDWHDYELDWQVGSVVFRVDGVELAHAAARLHQVDWHVLGVGAFLPTVAMADAARAQVIYWDELFRRQRLEPLPVAVFAFDWLRDHLPPTDRVAIVHGDLRFGNLLYDGGRISALLDWEMVHLGDAIEDLAWAYRSLWSLEKFLPVVS